MKPLLFLLHLGYLLYPKGLMAQNVSKIVFIYRCVPTSTTDYSIEISSDKFILRKEEIIQNRKGYFKRVDSSKYTYLFDSLEKQTLTNIVKLNKLDSVGLYQERHTEWGTLWEVHIQQNAISYNIDLPNYNNPGLDSLIHFIVCLIPKKQRPVFECKKCDLNN